MIVECLRQLRSPFGLTIDAGPLSPTGPDANFKDKRPLGLEDLVCVLMTCARSTCKPVPAPGPITKDLLRECLSYLGNSNVGRVCIEWFYSIDHRVSWRGCTEINFLFPRSRYFRYLKVIDFEESSISEMVPIDIRKNKWLEGLTNMREHIFYKSLDDYGEEDEVDEEYVVGKFYEYPNFLSNLTKYENYQINFSNNKQLTDLILACANTCEIPKCISLQGNH